MSYPEDRKLGLFSTILLGINGIIGSGIFLLPGQVMTLAGSWTPVVYLFAALIVLSIAWCFAQCASLFHRNGGAYVYAKAAFGNFVGFQIGLMRWVAGVIAWAAIVVGLLTALSSVWPKALQEPTRSLLATGIIGGLGIVNILGIKTLKGLNNIITIAKIIPLLLFIFIGIFHIEQSNLQPAIRQNFPLETFGGASLLIFYAFGGFEGMTVAAEDIKNPKKNIPVAVMLAIIFSSSLYLLVQMIATGILGINLSDSATPIADSAEKLFGTFGKWFVTIAMLVSIGGINIAASFVTPRSGAALANDRMLPPIIGMKGRFGTPSIAIAITVLLTLLMTFVGNFAQLAAISVISRFVQYISTCLAVLVFHKDRAFHAGLPRKNWKILIPLFALSGIIWLLSQCSLPQLYWGLGFLGFGIPLYFIQKQYLVQKA